MNHPAAPAPATEPTSTSASGVVISGVLRLLRSSLVRRLFVVAMAAGVAMIAAAFYPKDVIIRLSDFKTNEYANLVGGQAYEPQEENPMLGFRGASRYIADSFRR